MIVGILNVAFGFFNFIFGFDKFSEAAREAYTGKKKPPPKPKASEKSDAQKNAEAARDLQRAMESCECCPFLRIVGAADHRWHVVQMSSRIRTQISIGEGHVVYRCLPKVCPGYNVSDACSVRFYERCFCKNLMAASAESWIEEYQRVSC